MIRLLMPLLVVASSVSAAENDPLDWTYWRGPELNGISREKNLPDKWSPDGENLVWASDALGSRSTPIVMGGKLYTICRHNPHTKYEAEKVVCADAATGKVLWENIFNVFESDVPDTRVGWSAVVGDPETGNVFCQGVSGNFLCINGETGATIWSRPLHEEFGLLTTYGGRTNFPIIHEDLVIISGVVIGWGEMARPSHRVLGFQKSNGQAVWFSSTRPSPEDTTYSAPIIATINGQKQFILGTGDGGVWSFQPRTGKPLWSYFVSLRGLNTAPVYADGMVICGHSEENLGDNKMGALFAIDPTKSGDITKTGEIWKTKEMFIGKTAPIVLDGRIYAIDDGGNFFVVDLKTGEEIGKQKLGTMGRGSPVYGDGKFYCAEANGRIYIFAPDEKKGLKKIHQVRLDAEINGSPIISHGRVYIPTDNMMYCIGLKDVEPSADPIPPQPEETPVAENPEPATVVVAPVESLLYPGQKQPYQVRLYNKLGQFLKVVDSKDVTFIVDGPGTIGADGKYVSENSREHTAAIVTAKVGELTGTARIRVVPEFPWSFTYDDAIVPITGVGMRYRHVGLDFDLFQKLKAEDVLTAKVYTYLKTSFVNSGRDAAKYDDSTPAQAWTQFRRYLGLLETVTNAEQAKATLDPHLKRMVEEGVLESFAWTGTPETGTQLSVKAGKGREIGNGVMCKITTIPKGTRSQGWLGHADSRDYVIQADVYAVAWPTEAPDPIALMPDAGIMGQRYRLELMGASQQLKVYSWYPHDQKYFEVPFQWSTEKWYTMKLQVTTDSRDGEDWSLVQGKVWETGTPEPEAWSIEWRDRPANYSGSPGLFGNVKQSELFFDNVKVTSLKPTTTAAK